MSKAKRPESEQASESEQERETAILKESIRQLETRHDQHASIIIDLNSKVRRYDHLVRFSDVISTLALNQKASDREISKQGLEKIHELLECEIVLIYKVDVARNQIFSTRYDVDDKKQKQTIRYPIDDETLPGACAFRRVLVNVPDVSRDQRYRPLEEDKILRVQARNMVLVPLVVQDELLGVIQAINSTKNSFNQDDLLFLQTVANQMTLIAKYIESVDLVKRQLLQVSQALADVIGKKDAYTGQHTKRVAHFAYALGKELGLGPSELEDLQLAGVLHDIGKIGIDDQILRKRAQLSTDEYKLMQKHPHFGYEILQNIDGLKNVVDGVRYHHERPDGRGYPYGLKGKDIPLIAQIISVVDTFDAIISDRPYRKGLSPQVALKEIMEFRGRQFSETVVDAFVKVFNQSMEGKSGEAISENIQKQAKDWKKAG